MYCNNYLERHLFILNVVLKIVQVRENKLAFLAKQLLTQLEHILLQMVKRGFISKSIQFSFILKYKLDSSHKYLRIVCF